MSRMCALFLALSGALLAQTSTGTIVGSVLDPSGLAIGGAEVTLTNPAMGFERRATTADKGSFAFPSLTPGEYRLSVKREGFKTAERRKLKLTVSETLTVGEVKLEVGSTNESVTITAQGAMVQTASAERAGLVTSQQVEGLLIRGRNFVTLDGMTAVDIGNNNSGTAAYDKQKAGDFLDLFQETGLLYQPLIAFNFAEDHPFVANLVRSLPLPEVTRLVGKFWRPGHARFGEPAVGRKAGH